MVKIIGPVKTLLAAVLLVSCAKMQEPALLPLPKQVEYDGGSIRAGAPETVAFVESIPEAVLNENEAYRLTIDKAGVQIEAVTEHGVWNARQTLRQLTQKGRIPCCRIVDWPSFRVRGWMMDVGRTYVSLAELKREVEVFSQFKVNVRSSMLRKACCASRESFIRRTRCASWTPIAGKGA